jgi:Fe-S oxidoreductase
VSVFRDELVNLFPDDEDARRLSKQSFLLSEFLTRCEGYRPPRLNSKALVHGHCHHKALMGMGAEEKVLTDLGLDFQVLDSGCCGLAGSFGFEKDHYDLSMKIGERALLPAVREAPPDVLVIADGFSCREQIEHGTGRRALHLAEVIQLAARAEAEPMERGHPGVSRIAEGAPVLSKRTVRAALIAGGVLAAAGGLLWLARRRARA